MAPASPKKPKTESTTSHNEQNAMAFPNKPKTENIDSEYEQKPVSPSKKPKIEIEIQTIPSEHETTTMASPKVPKTETATISQSVPATMASLNTPKTETTTMSQYEKQREENIRRNREIFSSLQIHQKSSDLSSLLSPQRRKPATKPPSKGQNSQITPRKSLRSRGLPPQFIQISNYALPPPPPPPVPSSPFLFSDVYTSTNVNSYHPLMEKVQKDEERGERKCEITNDNFDLRVDLELKEDNVRKIVRERIMVLKFLPVCDREIILTGNKEGFLGFWDVNLESENKDADDVFVFFPHRSPVSGLAVHPDLVRKIYSSCYGGDLCLMDLEREKFNMVYSSNDPIFSLHQSPNNHNLLYLGQGGPVNCFDERVGEICNTWELHSQRINTIDFNPNNSNIFATSCTDGFARIWDLRKIKKNNSEYINEIQHTRKVRSAYFSPTGTCLVSTSMDDTIRVLSGSNYDNLSLIKHDNQIDNRFSAFRAIWGWSDSYILIGNTRKGIDVISTNDSAITTIKSDNMTNIPCRFAINPYKEGHLFCASGGKLYLWTKI